MMAFMDTMIALYETLGIAMDPETAKIYCRMDIKRVIQSRRILIDQSKRYHKKQRRGTKTTKQIKKHDPGYDSGKYSAAKKLDFEPSSDSEQEELSYKASTREISDSLEPSTPGPSTQGPSIPGPSTPMEEIMDQEEIERCVICNGTDEDGFIGIGLTIPEVDEEIAWVSYLHCHNWFHLICLGLSMEDVEDDDWYIDVC